LAKPFPYLFQFLEDSQADEMKLGVSLLHGTLIVLNNSRSYPFLFS
jgi:hypothetical protein